MTQQSTLILPEPFPEELSEAEQATRQARKAYLLEQGRRRRLSKAYDAGQLREMLAGLRAREGRLSMETVTPSNLPPSPTQQAREKMD